MRILVGLVWTVDDRQRFGINCHGDSSDVPVRLREGEANIGIFRTGTVARLML